MVRVIVCCLFSVLNACTGVSQSLELVRYQDPQPPYPYDTLDVEFRNPYDDVVLAGTITQPKRRGKYPAVILVTGSGPQNRDSYVEGHRSFKVLADHLTRHGIVVLRYDDRGVAKSGGNFVKSTIGDFSKDVTAGLRFLKSQVQVDSTRVGVVGHSEGGLIAFLMAGQHIPDMKFGVALAGPSIAIDSLMVLQLYHVGKSKGMTEDELSKIMPINRRNFALLKSNIAMEAARTLLLDTMSELVDRSSRRVLEREVAIMVMEPYRYFIRIDPVPFIQKIQVPFFAAYAERDVQVPPAENMESLADHMPPNSKSVIKTYSKLNHLFQPAKTGAYDEYAKITTTMDEDLMRDIVLWIEGL